jgi:catechol 2,3-dioxygenase
MNTVISELQAAPIAVSADRLPDSTRIEYARFLVSDLSSSLHFYRDLVGLNETWSRDNTTALSASPDGAPVVLLTEDRTAQPRPSHSAGLFHMALLYPTRRDLAAAFMRLHNQGRQFHGFADHGVSEALYMADPDGNGVELYFDKPREQWPRRNGELEMVTEPLDLENLLAELTSEPQQISDQKLGIGHMHLQVTNLQAAEAFYVETLGFTITQSSFPGALFTAAAGYHHHIGLNVWNSRNGAQSKEGTRGLVQFGIRVGSRDVVQSIAVRLRNTPHWLKETEQGILVRDTDNIRMEII